ncbi:MAG: hypothetical protein WKF35_06565 [Ferruginibacter sp.]
MSNRYEEPDLKKILLIAFGLRMLGVFVYSMMVQYYYGYGDSFTYHDGGDFFHEQIKKDFSSIKYLFLPFQETRDWFESISMDKGLSAYFGTPSNNMIMRISGLLSFLSFNKFLIISLFFGFFSFLGQWKLFMVFDHINKHRNRKLLAFAVLYSPSIWFWGSGLLKDSICIGAIGFIIHIFYKIIVLHKFSFKDLFILAFLILIVTFIKFYITSILLVGFMVMLFLIFLKSIKNKIFRTFLLVVAIIITGVFLYASDFSAQINDMAEESISQIQLYQQNYQILQNSEENSKAGFVFELEPTLTSLITKSPTVVFTCLFRPFLWESRKIIILFTSLESTMLFLTILFIMIKMGFINFFRTILTRPFLLFCFTITILFALIIGFTTFNFGTMIRYKIIFLPFLYFMLVNLYSNYLQKVTPLPVQ